MLAKSLDLDRLVTLDARLVSAAKHIKVLSHLSWPKDACPSFLKGWRAGNASLPQVPLPRLDFRDNARELASVMKACDRVHPLGHYVYKTAASYLTAAEMMAHAGSKTFTTLSATLYGRPTDPIGAGELTHLDAADHFIRTTNEFIAATPHGTDGLTYTPEHVAAELEKTFVPFFARHQIHVVIDPSLAAKAAAGSMRIRIRGGTGYTAIDIGQLIQHEGFVHMLTMLNGREQPHFKSMGLGSPRTTRTQEGLATFAELVTSTMDLARLRRLALRIRGVHMALEGADFIEVFQFFLNAGQDEQESFQSAARIFRGGDVRGGVVFTKDVVYLQGLTFTHTFLRKAIQENKAQYINYLFAGRLTLSDVIDLEPYFLSGLLAPPQYEPPWLQNRQCLAAYLSYAVFTDKIALGKIELADFQARDL